MEDEDDGGGGDDDRGTMKCKRSQVLLVVVELVSSRLLVGRTIGRLGRLLGIATAPTLMMTSLLPFLWRLPRRLLHSEHESTTRPQIPAWMSIRMSIALGFGSSAAAAGIIRKLTHHYLWKDTYWLGRSQSLVKNVTRFLCITYRCLQNAIYTLSIIDNKWQNIASNSSNINGSLFRQRRILCSVWCSYCIGWTSGGGKGRAYSNRYSVAFTAEQS